MNRLRKPLLVISATLLLLFTTNSSAHAQTSQIIGYYGTYGGLLASACTGTSNPAQLPIYGNNQSQTILYNCVDYIQINTHDTLKVGCFAADSSDTYLTGPGTFTAPSFYSSQCAGPTSSSIWVNTIQDTSPQCTLSVAPTTAKPGDSLFITGTSFPSTGNNVQFTNTADDTRSFTANNQGGGGTSIIMAVPSATHSGTYSITVSSAPSCNPATIQIQNPTDAPSNLTGTVDLKGKVTLNWINNAQGQTGIRIQSSYNGDPKSLTNHVDVGNPITSYTDDLNQYISSDNPSFSSTSEVYRVAGKLPDGTYTNFSNIATVSNCVLLSGSGPIKVVFMRTKDTAQLDDMDSVSNYVNLVNQAIRSGFMSIEPYKTYIDNFSFYIDLKLQNNAYENIGSDSSFSALKSVSSCGPSNNQYILLTNTDYQDDLGAWSVLNKGGTIIDLNPDSLNAMGNPPLGVIVSHETAHAIAGLLDEYFNPTGHAGMWGNLQAIIAHAGGTSAENCSVTPTWDYRSSIDNHVYGSVVDQGCTYLLAETAPGAKHPTAYYRPSTVSIMGYTTTNTLAQDQFNVVSCGYVDAVLHGLPATKDNAQIYWPECLAMAQKGNVIKDGIVPVSPTPAISKISDKTLAPSSDPTTQSISKLSRKSSSGVTSNPNITITGSNFSTTPTNTVKLTNTLSSSIYYEIPNLASADGKTLTFSLPDSIPLGKYNLQVGAFNSDYSKSIAVTVLLAGSTSLTPPKNSPIPPPSIPPLYDFGGMYGGNSTNVNPATGALSCPSGYGSVLVYNGKGNPAYSLYICVRAHVSGQDPLYDFGGIYETAPFIGAPHDDNVATGKMTCPSGFSAAQVVGGNALTDGSWNFCYSLYSANHYYNFGGMYGTSANIVTGTKKCPIGYTALTLNALPVTYCYQPTYTPITPPILKATAISGSQIQLTWTISGTQGLNSYTLHDYSTGITNYDNNGDVILHVNTDGIPSTATSFIVSGLSAKTKTCYSLKASAFYDVKESNIACATTLAAAVPTTPQSDMPVTQVPANPTSNPIFAPSNPPQLSAISGPTTLNAGDTAKWSFSATDPQGSTMTYSIDWGDSSGASTSAVPSFKHSYAMSGVYTIIASAKDSAGLMGQTTLSVVVASPASTPSASAPAPSNSSPSVTVSLVDGSSDKAGTFGVFGPGKGAQNNGNPYDWHFTATINAAGKTIQSIRILSNDNWQGWSTIDPGNYPMVVYVNGSQINHSYTSLNLTANPTVLDLYGQPETTTWPGGNILVTFTDSTTATALIAASSVTIQTGVSSVTKESYMANALDGIVAWLHAITLW